MIVPMSEQIDSPRPVEVAIIGAGPSGAAAAIHAAQNAQTGDLLRKSVVEAGHDPGEVTLALQILADGRFTLGLGSGENLNEHVVGAAAAVAGAAAAFAPGAGTGTAPAAS